MGDSYTASFQMQRAQIAQFAKEPKTIRDIEQLGYLLNNTVPTLLGTKVDETRLLIAGAGLTGGGDLSGDITFNVGQGTGMIINADDIAIDLVAEAERIRDVMGTALIDTATIDFTADDAADTIKADLKNTTVTPGSYTSASITVDAQGRLTAASSGSVAAGSIGPTELASTSVTPGSYTNTNLTVDADGRLTAASNGSAGSGGGAVFARNTAVPSGSLSALAFASKGHVITPLYAVTISSVWFRFTPVAGATYIAKLDEVGADLTIDTSHASTSNTVSGTSEDWFKFSFSSPVSFTAGLRFVAALVRTDSTTTYVLPIATASGNGVLAGLPALISVNTVRLASVGPGVGDTYVDTGSAGSYVFALEGTW